MPEGRDFTSFTFDLLQLAEDMTYRGCAVRLTESIFKLISTADVKVPCRENEIWLY